MNNWTADQHKDHTKAPLNLGPLIFHKFFCEKSENHALNDGRPWQPFLQ
jgi:hypothetical protein